MRYLFIFLPLLLIFPALNADEGQKLIQHIEKELTKAQKSLGLDQQLLPNIKSKEWKVHLIAKEDAFSEVIEVQGDSIVHVGKILRADRIVIHGDGIIWVQGEVQCPSIDIQGKGLVMFESNAVNFIGGWIKLNSGAILAKGVNQMDVHFRQGGFLRTGAENFGEVLVSTGSLILDVQGTQKGDLNLLGATGKSNINITGNFEGTFFAKGDIFLEVGGDIHQDLVGEAEVHLKAKKVLGQQLNAQGGLIADVEQLGERLKPLSINAKTANVKVAKGRFGDISLVENGDFLIGGVSEGSITTLKGSISVKVGLHHVGNLSASSSLSLEAKDAKGQLVAGQNLTAMIKESLISHRLACGGNGIISCSIFKGNMDIKGIANVSATETRKCPFANRISVGSGKISIKGHHQLNTHSMSDLELAAQRGTGSISIGGKGMVSFSKDHDGKILVKGPLSLSVGGLQFGSVYGGDLGDVELGSLASGLTILGESKVRIGQLHLVAYEDSSLNLGSGVLKILSDAIFDISGLNSSKWLNVSVEGNRSASAQSNGHLAFIIKGTSTGNIVTKGQLKFQAESHHGKVEVGQTCLVSVSKDWVGDLISLGKNGESSFSASNVLDSNLLFESGLNLKVDKILNRQPGEEQIRLKTGSILVLEELESNVMGVGKITIKARRIVGDVFVDAASRVDSIVRGRLRTGLN